VVLGFELKALHLLDRHSTAWATHPALFALVILETGSQFLPRLAWTTILLFYTSCCDWDSRSAPPCLFSVEMRSCWLCVLDWPWTMILLISAQTMSSYVCLPCSWDDRHTLYIQLIDWVGGLTNFLPGLTSSCQLQNLHLSHIARITSVSHCAYPGSSFVKGWTILSNLLMMYLWFFFSFVFWTNFSGVWVGNAELVTFVHWCPPVVRWCLFVGSHFKIQVIIGSWQGFP
jgi:hypothetical protein